MKLCFYSEETFRKRRGSQDVPIITCTKLRFYPEYLCSLKEPICKWEFFVSKYQDISSLCGWINVLKYSYWTLHSLESYHVVRARSPFFFSGFEEWNTAKSVRKVRFEGQLFLPRRYERITTCWVFFSQMEFAISWYFMFSFTLTTLFHLCFFRQRRQRWPKRYGITNKSLG